jgi:hypothetical protein
LMLVSPIVAAAPLEPEYKTFKHYNSNNLKVLNGYS